MAEQKRRDGLIKDEKEKNVKFDIQLNEEQRRAKEQILSHPFSFVHGKAGSGKHYSPLLLLPINYSRRTYQK
jgi:phosphate starvation-inducible protein PhoH